MIARKRKVYTKSDRQEMLVATLFFLPFGILFLIFTILPVVIGLYFSMTTYSVIQHPVFVGLRNFQHLITENNSFVLALSNTFTFAFFTGLLGYFASFFMAYIIDGMAGRKILALAFYAPSITSGIAMSVIWLYFFSPDINGLVNSTLVRFGLINSPILWTEDPKRILFIVTVVSVWMSMGNGFLAFLAGFQNMNREIFEAGLIDGIHNKFQEMIYIVLPQMKPMLLFGAVNTIVSAFSINDIPTAMAGYPGPNNSTMTIVGLMNDYAFSRLDLGYATSIAMVLFAITFTLGRVVFKVLDSKDQ
jgi:multiple sugar transport system permease protein